MRQGMAEFDEIRLFFSVVEKIAFLERHGWLVKRRHVEREVHLHGSLFVPFLVVEMIATKGDESLDMHKAFETELRKELLKL